MPRPILTDNQSNYLIRIVDINSYTKWQTVQIQISWLPQKQGISGFSRTRINIFQTVVVWLFLSVVCLVWAASQLKATFRSSGNDFNLPLPHPAQIVVVSVYPSNVISVLQIVVIACQLLQLCHCVFSMPTPLRAYSVTYPSVRPPPSASGVGNLRSSVSGGGVRVLWTYF